MHQRLSLSAAALRLGMTYHQARAALLRGQLRGGQDEFGRFYVEQGSVRDFEAARSQGASHTATAMEVLDGSR